MEHQTTIGTAGGTLLTILTIPTTSLINTVILAALGAAVSFFVSLGLKLLFEYLKKK